MTDQAQDERAIFFAALERPAGPERDAYLREACNGECDLLNRVQWLFSLHEQSQGPLDSPPPGICVTATTNQPTEQPGTVIGRYKLLEQVGEGGMGVVYVAEQTEPVRRRVALKIIKPGMDTKQVIARFEAERQALAMMDHPNIARVLDAGTTEAGRPYFVMELVRGMPITEYCDKARLSPRQRLELFVDVCQAVQHAHQKGIIHRDLKPSNVMVTLHDGTPVVKVIDFGVAKAVGQQLTERTIYTALTQLVGTPLYMSPEQAEMSGLDVDTRSDVYSLGVLLYELLTGQTPFDKETLSKAGLDEMRRIIREDEPLRPSRRFSTLGAAAISTASQHRGLDERRLSKILCGELDWIVMKALEKDRSRRYESASAFATDIQRYLSDEPVLACPPTTMYRFQKFARKHRPALFTAAAIAACLILGTTVSAWQAVRATEAEAQAKQAAASESSQRQRAEANEQKANAERDEVKALNEKLAAKEQQLQRNLYASNMNLAKSAWDAGNIRRADELLAQHRPKPGEIDLRGFEWHYLYKLCHSDLLTLKGHMRSMPADGCLAYSPDGHRLAGANQDGTVTVWDAETGKELLRLKDGGECVAFSPDGKRLATGIDSWDEMKKTNVPAEVKVWDAETGRAIHSLKGHTHAVISVAFSPDGKLLASGSGGAADEDDVGEVKVWDAETGRELHTFKAAGAMSVAFSPDGSRLACAANEVTVWDIATGRVLVTLKGSGVSVTFSPDGKRLVCAPHGPMGDVTLWDSRTGKELLAIRGIICSSAAFSPDGQQLATAGRDVKVWDAQSGQEIMSFKGHTGWVTSVRFNSDGTKLASGSNDGTVKVWDAAAGREPRDFSGSKMRFSPDGQRVAFATIVRWDEMKNAYTDVAVKVADSRSGKDIFSLSGHDKPINCVAYSPDGRRIASGSTDQTVKVWDAQSGKEHLTFKGHTAAVVSVVFSPDSTRLASCSSHPMSWNHNGDPGEPGEVKLWDAASGAEILTLQGHKRFVNCVAFSPDGKRLATISRDNTVKVWDAASGREILTLNVPASLIGSIAFSPDGKRLASSMSRGGASGPGAAGAVKVWDANTGEELFTLTGHSGNVTSVAFSPDGKRLVTGSSAGASSLGERKVWDAQTGLELLTLEGGVQSNSLAFSTDGHLLAAGRKIYDATPLPEKP